MARLFTCADVLEQLEDSNGDVSSGDDSAYEGEGIVGYLPKATSFMPDAPLSFFVAHRDSLSSSPNKGTSIL